MSSRTPETDDGTSSVDTGRRTKPTGARAAHLDGNVASAIAEYAPALIDAVADAVRPGAGAC
ncbi:MAG: hypothetical protein AB7V74_22310 [Acidimicrobiia bacterium]